MHCYQADFSTFQILPPYNVFWAQVIQRGKKPAIITTFGNKLRAASRCSVIHAMLIRPWVFTKTRTVNRACPRPGTASTPAR
jgi:hypothetical protein